MSWTERIEEATNWQSINSQIDWERSEIELGTALPTDFKEMCISFGRGEFSGYLEIYSANTGQKIKIVERISGIRRTVETIESSAMAYHPYGIFTAGEGRLIPWGESVTGVEFYWLNDSQEPDSWPVVARPEDGKWSRFSMSTSEFIFRLLTDIEFEDFGIAHLVSPPFYELY